MAHYPSYASKYNPIEHRLFCHITNACKGAIFSSIDVVKSLVDKASTSKGLKVFSTIKDKVYATARKVSEDFKHCLLYTSDAADDLLCVDLGGRRIIKKKKNNIKQTE